MLAVAALGIAAFIQTPPYLDPSQGFEVRAKDLVARMTLPERISQMMNVAPAIPRLGVPAYDWWSESLHGPIGGNVTVFPQAIGLAATFDLDLMGRVATAISDEGRGRYQEAIKSGRSGMHEGLTFWAPNINIFRDPRWGRGQETYGEDPFLTARMAVAYVRAMQDEKDGTLKSVATPKHYAVHSGPDPERHAFNAVVDHRDWWNTYLPAFRASILEANAWSVMSAYSAIDGVPASANRLFLQDILRDRWGFKGYVVSDCGAIADIVYGHKFAPDRPAGAALAVKAGCDLECGDMYKGLLEAVQRGEIDEPAINRSVERLFEARMRLGMFDPAGSGRFARLGKADVDTPAHRALAREAARKSLVLLKNDGFLPLKNVRNLAVIGPHADNRGIPLGNYNGSPSKTVTLLEGIRAAAPRGTVVRHTLGSDLTSESALAPVPAANLSTVAIEYRAGKSFDGPALVQTTSPQIDFNWVDDSPAGVPKDGFTGRFRTRLRPTKTGVHRLGATADDGVRITVDGKLLAEDWSNHAAKTTSAEIALTAGREVEVVVDYYEDAGQASIALVWAPPGTQAFDEAVALARASDAVVLALGISGEIENEERDRADITLPLAQQRLLAAVVATGKPVVVVLESGSCLALDDRRIRGLIQAWYPGEEGGTAVGEALFGRFSPSGRLPVTFYRSLAQVPPFRDYRMAGRTYRYLDAKPQYPFGHGLSYAKFATSSPTFHFRPGAPGEAAATVTNLSKVPGEEVVQVYAARKGAAWPEPKVRLVGFARVRLAAGEARRVVVPIHPEAMLTADAQGGLALVPGDYTISIGGGLPGQEPATSGRSALVRVRL